MFRQFALATLALCAALPLGALPAAAHSMTATDCSTAPAAMHDTMMMMPAMKPSGNVDKDFMAMMGAQHAAMVKVAKIEAACGTDPKTKAAAQSFLNKQGALFTDFAANPTEHTN